MTNPTVSHTSNRVCRLVTNWHPPKLLTAWAFPACTILSPSTEWLANKQVEVEPKEETLLSECLIDPLGRCAYHLGAIFLLDAAGGVLASHLRLRSQTKTAFFFFYQGPPMDELEARVYKIILPLPKVNGLLLT